MHALAAVAKVGVFIAGLLVCLAILPFEYAFLAVRKSAAHAWVAISRALAVPFVVFASALRDPEIWPEFLRRWRRAHQQIEYRWDWPLQRLRQLQKWLPPRLQRKRVVVSGCVSVASLGSSGALPPARIGPVRLVARPTPSRSSSTAA
jgi:hypothetical protein